MALEQNGRVVLKIYKGKDLIIARPFASQDIAEKWLAGEEGKTPRYPENEGFERTFAAGVPRI